MLLRLANFLFRRYIYVVADPSDNSVTLSPLLLEFVLRVTGLGENKVFAFRLSSRGEYAFTLNPDISGDTVTAPIQWNSKRRCSGFACNCPSVNRILYDYGIDRTAPARIPVKIRRIGSKYIFVLKQTITKNPL